MIAKYFINILGVFFVFAGIAHAVDYPKGHQALEIFDEQGMQATPQWVMVWIMFMAASFTAGLFFI